MTAKREVTIWCDIDGCSVWEGFGRTAKEARTAVSGLGWSRKGSLDVCPGCAYDADAAELAARGTVVFEVEFEFEPEDGEHERDMLGPVEFEPEEGEPAWQGTS